MLRRFERSFADTFTDTRLFAGCVKRENINGGQRTRTSKLLRVPHFECDTPFHESVVNPSPATTYRLRTDAAHHRAPTRANRHALTLSLTPPWSPPMRRTRNEMTEQNKAHSGGWVCADCGASAVCFGRYEHMAFASFACDECCGHGNEDGQCILIVAEWAVGDESRTRPRSRLALVPDSATPGLSS